MGKVFYYLSMPQRISFLPYSIISILFFLCVNHFDGFVQDAVLYTLQAMHHIDSDRFMGDIAFMYGSQDDFTLFSPIYSFFIKTFPIDTAALLLCIIIHVLFAFSVALTAWKWTKILRCNWLAPIITLAFFALYSYGESRNEFVFTIKTIEAFPVPRTLSTTLGFVGLAFFNSKWKSLPCFILGTLIHPITAGWCLPLWCCYHFSKIRIPILVFSALIPLTIFVGKEPWAEAPREWINISFGNGHGEQTWKMLLFLFFFLFVALKTNCPPVLKRFLFAFCLVLGIATYWLIAELSIHHIFLHQAQVFRIQWICQFFAVFLSIWQTSRIYILKVRRKTTLSTYEKIFFIFLLILWIDSSFVLSLLGLFSFSLLFHTKKMSTLWLGIIFGICLSCICLMIFWIYSFEPCPKPEWSYADKLLVMGPLFGFCAAAILFLSVKTSKLRLLGVILSSALVCAILYAWTILPKENFGIAYILAALIICCVLTWYKQYRAKTVVFAVLTLFSSIIIILNYDHRPYEQKNSENAMNQFVQQPPFPYITNRGKILFSVFDNGENIPRLRFLSGGYYDYQIEGGAMFSKQHKLAVTLHEWKIYGGEKEFDSSWTIQNHEERASKISEILFDKDSLQKRTAWLCKTGEITHLISDMQMSFAARDSLTLQHGNKIIRLYPCL